MLDPDENDCQLMMKAFKEAVELRSEGKPAWLDVASLTCDHSPFEYPWNMDKAKRTLPESLMKPEYKECSCKDGTCSEENWNNGGVYQREKHQCCTLKDSSKRSSPDVSDCLDLRRTYVELVLAGKDPSSQDSRECVEHLKNLSDSLEKFAESADFNGHHIKSLHAKHFALDLLYSLFAGGDDESHGLLYETHGKPFSFWVGLPKQERTDLARNIGVIYLHPDLPLGPLTKR